MELLRQLPSARTGLRFPREGWGVRPKVKVLPGSELPSRREEAPGAGLSLHMVPWRHGPGTCTRVPCWAPAYLSPSTAQA